jgi:hypothetical protein
LAKADESSSTGDGDDWLVGIGEPAGAKNAKIHKSGGKKKKNKGKKKK